MNFIKLMNLKFVIKVSLLSVYMYVLILIVTNAYLHIFFIFNLKVNNCVCMAKCCITYNQDNECMPR